MTQFEEPPQWRGRAISSRVNEAGFEVATTLEVEPDSRGLRQALAGRMDVRFELRRELR